MQETKTPTTDRPTDAAGWSAALAEFRAPCHRRAVWQVVNSFGGYLGLWALMAWTVTISWWLTVPIAILAGALLVRVFIILHDCGHGSFVASKKLGDWIGTAAGVLTFTPYRHWRGQHAIHHGTAGNLDGRGSGDVWTMTVQEYLDAPRWKRFAYRLMRNPFFLLGLAPIGMFLFQQRISHPKATKREKRSVWVTNVALVVVAFLASLAFGFWTYFLIQLLVLAVAGGIGVWLFYLQHQFEDTYWQRGESWDFVDAALQGSAYLRLPRVLQWFTGNIGFHHVHHLDARIPNYRLQACHEAHAEFREVNTLTLFRSIRVFGLALWDEASQKLVHFGFVKGRTRRLA